jgi:hypothetical protein
MSAARDPDGVRLSGVFAGEAIGRRRLLRLGASATLGLVMPAAVPACGTVTPMPLHNSYPIDVARSTNPPLDVLTRLVMQRADALQMAPAVLGEWNEPLLAGQTGHALTFDLATNRYPPDNLLIVIGAVNLVEAEPLLERGIRSGIQIVGYPVALRHQTAAILVDASAAAGILATHAATWVQNRLQGHAEALIVLPPDVATLAYAPQSAAIEQTLRVTVGRLAPGLVIRSTTQASGSSDAATAVGRALAEHSGVQVILVWDDDTAIGAAEALRTHQADSRRDQRYVGALGLPAVATAATLRELHRDDVLRVVVAARARDLASAMVDLPHALLGGQRSADVRLELQTLTPRSVSSLDYARDYTG